MIRAYRSFLDLGLSLFSRDSPARENYRPEREHNWKERRSSSHDFLPYRGESMYRAAISS
jgi:hypothetical protein